MKGLSILIPVFNNNVSALVHDLHQQALALDCPCEIIMADDASSEEFRSVNRDLVSLPNVRYEQMPQNVGRAIIRNRLAGFAQYDYLVFMDCDVAMVDADYLKRYVDLADKHQVIYGGFTYKPSQRRDDCLLRWTYDTKVNTLPAAKRSVSPYSYFSTVNFFIRRDVMLAYPFNSKLSAYGHEDSMLRSDLEDNHISILHIDNPVYHMHLDENHVFLDKTKKAIQNMLVIKADPVFEKLTHNLNLLRYYGKLQRWHLTVPFKFFFKLVEKPLVWNLMSSSPSLYLFQLYKLGYLSQIAEK